MLKSAATAVPLAIIVVMLGGAVATAATHGHLKRHGAASAKSKQGSQNARREAEAIGRAAGNGCRGTAAIPHDYMAPPMPKASDWVVLCSSGQTYRVHLASPGVAGWAMPCSLARTAGPNWCFE